MISHNSTKINIPHTVKDIRLDHTACISKLCNQLFHLITLGTTSAPTAYTVLGETACTLNEVQPISISPCLDRRFLDQIHGTDQFHSLKILTVQLRHHSLHLTTVQHTHEDCLDHIIKMMSQRNLITSQLLGMRIQITTSHSRTKITGIILNFCHCIKNITFKNRKRNSQKLCIILNNLPVIRIIARIHYQKHQFKMNLPMTLQLLKQLRHQHRVLTT